MLRSKLLVLLACLPVLLSAQNQVEVASLELDPNSPTAVNDKVLDADGEVCAVVVIENIIDTNYTFPQSRQVTPAQDAASGKNYYKVYIPQGTKSFKIRHPKLGETVVQFPRRVKSAETWLLMLKNVRLTRAVGGKQYLTIAVEPADAAKSAIVEVSDRGSANGDLWVLGEDGKSSRAIEAGLYTIKVSATDYYDSFENFEFNAENPEEKVITLKPKFGFLTIEGTDDLAGAAIVIDNRPVGTGAIANYRLGSGTHTLRIGKDLYKDLQQDFTIVDGQTLRLPVTLIPDFATTQVSTSDPEAEIWRDGQLLGKGKWRGPIKKGRYLFETRRPYHTPEQKTVEVVDIENPVDIVLPAPMPIIGSLSVESQPMGSTISIDGKDMGVTPRIFNDILIGPHRITLSHAGYQAKTVDVNIEEGKPASVSETLSNISSARITTKPWGTYITDDGKQVKAEDGVYTITGPVGSVHKIHASYYGYKPQTRNITISPNSVSYNIVLKEEKLKKNCWYIEAGLSVPGILGLNVATGMYAAGFNAEFDFNYGFTKSKDIWYIGADGHYSKWQYSPMEMGLRLGYGIDCGTTFRLTPQVGFNYTTIPGTEKEGVSNGKGYGLKKTYGTAVLVGLRCYYAINKTIGIALTPEYRIKAKTGDNFQPLADLDSTVKNSVSGFNAKLAISFAF